MDYEVEDSPAKKAHDKRLRDGVLFDMRGGPWDGCMLRIFTPEWNVWSVPEFGGSYVRPHDVDPHMKKAKPNKARSNVPHLVWETSV